MNSRATPTSQLQPFARRRSFLEHALDWLVALVAMIVLLCVGTDDFNEEQRAAALDAAAVDVQDHGLTFPIALDQAAEPLPADVRIVIVTQEGRQ